MESGPTEDRTSPAAHHRGAGRKRRRSASDERASTATDRPPLSLARRIVGWTNNLLASALVVALALTFGLRALGLWSDVRPEPRTPLVPLPSSIGSSDRTSSLAEWSLGSWSGRWRRDEFVGSRDSLLDRMAIDLEAILRQGETNGSFDTPASVRLLDRLAPEAAVRSVGDSGEVHVIAGPVPLGAAIRRDASGTRRIVAWGIAMPGETLADVDENPDAPPMPEPDPATESLETRADDSTESTLGGIASRDRIAAETETESEPRRRWVVTLCRPADKRGPSADQRGPIDDRSLEADSDLPADCEVTFAIDDPAAGRLVGFRSTARLDRLIAAIDASRAAKARPPLRWNVTVGEAIGSADPPERTSIRLTVDAGEVRGFRVE